MTAALTTRPALTERSLVRLVIATLVLTAALSLVGPVSNPTPVQAGTADYMEGLLLKWINEARDKKGVPALRTTDRLMDAAGDKAASMASNGRMAHTSCLSCTLRGRDVSFERCAEIIAWSSYPWGYDAARNIFLSWKGSSSHWGILMSRSYGRIGLGVAYRSGNRTTYAAGMLVGG